MSGLNLTKTSEYMTAKERAKMVIALQLKNLNEIAKEDWEKLRKGEQADFMMPGQAEVRMLVAGCPRDQANEYNHLIEIKDHVWEGILEQMRDGVNYLSIIQGKMSVTKQLFNLSPMFYYAVRELKRVPVVVSKVAYDEAVVQTREEERQEELPLEGRYNLAEQEAYYRQIQEGKIEEGGDLDGYLDFIGNYGRTKEDLIKEKVAEIKKGLEEYQERKKRLDGDEEPLMNFYSKYQGLTDEQTREKVVEGYYLEVPSDEEYQAWQVAVKQAGNKLDEAIKKGELVAKGKGILAGSYYDWKGRYQKFGGEEGVKDRAWNPLHEDCMEIGYSGGKVISASKAGSDWHQLVAVTVHNKDNMGFGGEDVGRKRVEGVAEMLEKFVLFELEDSNYDKKERIFRITDDGYKNVLVAGVEKAKETIQDLYNNLALIEAIEDKYFDGMELLNREPGRPFSIGSYFEQAKKFVERHNTDMRHIEIMFNRVSLGYWDCRLEEMDKFLLESDYKTDTEWVDRNLAMVERI